MGQRSARVAVGRSVPMARARRAAPRLASSHRATPKPSTTTPAAGRPPDPVEVDPPGDGGPADHQRESRPAPGQRRAVGGQARVPTHPASSTRATISAKAPDERR